MDNVPPGFSHRVTPAVALLEQWRRNGGRNGNVLRHGDEAAMERVAPAVSADQQPRVEMSAINAAAPFRRWATLSLNPQRFNLGSGAETLSMMFQGLGLSGFQEGMEIINCCGAPIFLYLPQNLPQASRFSGTLAPPINYMIQRFPNSVSPWCTCAGDDGGQEVVYTKNPRGAKMLYPNQKSDDICQEAVLRRLLIQWERSGWMKRDERAMNREELVLLLRLLKENTNAEITNDVVRVVCTRDVHRTMADEFGSQLFVALLEACNGREMEALVRAATSDGVQLTKVAGKKNFGCRCIKKVVEKVKTSPELSRCVANALAVGARHLMTADNGRDVLKHCFKHLTYDRTFVLVKAAAEGFMEYATDVKGCATLKYCISQARDPLRRFMMVKVATNALQLATHFYGNYVVQYVIDVEDSEDAKESIFLTMASNFVHVATNNCGSFILEKFLYTPKFGPQLCRVIASYGLSRPEVLEQIARDKHGNYVLQGALEVSVGAGPGIHRLLVRAIAGLPRSLMNDPYANKLYKTALRDLKSRQ